MTGFVGKEIMRPIVLQIIVDCAKDSFECVRDYSVTLLLKLKENLGEDYLASSVLNEIEKYHLLLT